MHIVTILFGWERIKHEHFTAIGVIMEPHIRQIRTLPP